MALVWLMDLEMGGRTQRLSTFPVAFTDPETGLTHHYKGRLDEVRFPERLAIGSTPSAREVSVDVLPTEDMALLKSYGHSFTGGRATLTLWDTEEANYLAQVMLRRARVSPPQWGARGEALSFTLSAEPFDDTASLIAADELVEASFPWQTAPDGSVGDAYPLPLGKPGILTGSDAASVGAYQAPVVETLEGSNYTISATLITPAYVLTIASSTHTELCTGMEVTYSENGGSITNMTDGATYYLREVGHNLATFNVYEDEGLTTMVQAAGTPAGSETFTVTQPYAVRALVASRPIEATQVLAWFDGEDLEGPQTFTVETQTAPNGRTVTVVDLSDLGKDPSAVSGFSAYFASRTALRLQDIYLALDGNGVAAPVTSGAISTVGELLAALAFWSSVPVDQASFQVAMAELPYPVGVVVTQDQTPMDLLTRIASTLPVGLFSGPNGLSIVRLPTEPRRNRAVPLVDGLTCFRDGDPRAENDEDDLANRVRVWFGLEERTGDYKGSRTLSSDPSAGSGDVYIRSSPVSESQVDQVISEELDWTYTAQTALVVSRWTSRQASVTPTKLSLLVPAKRARHLHLGQEVAFTSADLHVVAALGFVVAREPSSQGLWAVDVYFLHGVVSDVAEAPRGASSTPPVLPSGP